MSRTDRSRAYYDEFSASYEDQRHRGYHQLLDELEVDLVHRYGGDRVLEAGCGTGLILQRLQQNHREVVGVDLSAGMLARARGRGLQVVQASLEALPFADESFDTVCSFKVLAHVPRIERALAELARVTRPGGALLLEFYNLYSLRGAIKRLKQPTRIGQTYTDADVFTRLDTPARIRSYLPQSLHWEGVRGVRVLTPLAQAHDLPLFGPALAAAERVAADAPLLRWLGGFLIVILRKRRA